MESIKGVLSSSLKIRMFLWGWDDLDTSNFRPILYVLVGETSVCLNCSIKR